MADTALDLVINNLNQQYVENKQVFAGIEDEVRSLLGEFQSLNAFLKDTNKSRDSNRISKQLVKELSRIVNQAEDSIDRYVIEAKLYQNRSVVMRFNVSMFHYRKVKQFVRELKCIRDKFREIRRNNVYAFQYLLREDNNLPVQELRKAPVIEEEEEDVVGFDEEAKTIINRLCGGSAELEVIPIVGMPGLGKTTLAKKICMDAKVCYEFVICIWICVSQSYNQREIYLNIISKITRSVLQYQHEAEEALVDVISKLMVETKFLIVLDDVWTFEAVNDLKKAFRNNQKNSRIILTTRDSSLANRCNNSPHNLKFLTDDECWELLKKKVFRKDECPPDLQVVGRDIARKCRGLPLITLLVAEALIGKGKTRREWELVCQVVTERVIDSDHSMLIDLVRMSYDTLPSELKVCFLYCSAFPRGFDIPAWKLVRLWIAEGFIQYRGPRTPESVAEYYLNELVNKNLLIVMQRTSNGQIKTCRFHDMLHEFCRLEAIEENLFKEIKLGIEQSLPRNQELATHRRLCIDSSVVDFISTKPYAEGIRSFLCFSSSDDKIRAPTSWVGTISKAFPLLRVFEVESILFIINRQFFQLYNLRYIALSSDSLEVVPKIMGNLWNLQTLIIRTQKRTLDVRADICNMPQLRHFHTNVPAKLCPSAARISVDGTLQTLSVIEPESCKEPVFARCQKLKKLGIRGKIPVLPETKRVVPFMNANKLNFLEKMKLINENLLADGKLLLPSENIFPVSLKKVTLSGTGLDWNEMRRFGQLEVLEVLKLKENAFMGNTWDSTGHGFSSLKVLWIERSDLVSWKASSQQFPSLERLVLRSLDKLEEVPIELAKIRTLHEMNLDNTSRTAVESARKIEICSVCSGFKLSISPPDR